MKTKTHSVFPYLPGGQKTKCGDHAKQLCNVNNLTIIEGV